MDLFLVGWKSIPHNSKKYTGEKEKQASVMRRMANSEQRVFSRSSVSQSTKLTDQLRTRLAITADQLHNFFFSYWVPRKKLL